MNGKKLYVLILIIYFGYLLIEFIDTPPLNMTFEERCEDYQIPRGIDGIN